MRQVQVSRTVVLDAPRHARGFFEALIAANLDIGGPRTSARSALGASRFARRSIR